MSLSASILRGVPNSRERHLSDLRARATHLTQSRDWAAADVAWRELLSHNPDNVEDIVELADVLRHLRRFDEADSILRTVSQPAVGNKRFLVVFARTSAGTNRPEVGIERWLQVLRLDPDYFEAHLKIAILYETVDDPATAGVHFSRAQHLVPFHAELLRPMATHLVRIGKLEEAVPFYSRIVASSPRHLAWHTAFAKVLLQLGQVARADEVLGADRLGLRPNDEWLPARIKCDIALHRWPTVLSRLQLWLKTKRLPTASAELVWEAIHEALTEPDWGAVLDILTPVVGPLLSQIVDCARADHCYATGLTLLSRYGNAMSRRIQFQKARLLTDMRQYAAARSICSALLKSRMHELQALELLVEIFIDSKDWHKACSSQQKIVDLQPLSAREIRRLGEIYLKIDRLEAANDCALKALQLDASDAETIALLGATAYRRGDLHEAISFHNEAISLAPDNTNALFQLAQCHLALADREQSIAACCACLKVAPWHIDVFAILVKLEGTNSQDTLWSRHLLFVDAIPIKSARDWGFLAEAWIRLNKPAQAIEVLDRVPPDFGLAPALQLLKAHAFRLIGEHAKARDTVEKLLAASPFFYRAFDEYLQILSSSGEFASADAFVAAHPDYFKSPEFTERSLGLVTHVHYGLGRFTDAFSAYRQSSLSQSVQRVVGEAKFAHSFDQISGDDQTVVLAAWGLGDEINWSRLYPTLARRIPKLSFSCSPRLHSLLQRSYPALSFFPSDRWMGLEPLLSASHVPKYAGLPCLSMATVTDCAGWDVVKAADKVALMTDLLPQMSDMFVPSSGYLRPAPQRVAFWKNRLRTLGNKPKIGIAWSSLKVNHHRQLHLTELADWDPILSSREHTFICLEPDYRHDYTSSMVPKLGRYVNKMEGIDLINDLDNTAALISALDLVICVANSVSELAGALGVPTWVLNRSHTLDWRFASETKADVFQSSKTYCSVVPRADTARLMADVAGKLKRRQFNRVGL